MTSEATDANIAAAVDSVDKQSSSSTVATDGTNSDDPKTVKGMLAAMNKHSDGTNVIKESIKVGSIVMD